MKILLAHNFYGSSAPSGENVVFEAERALLEAKGHDVETFTRHSDDIRKHKLRGAVRGALSTPWSRSAAREFRTKVESFRPDVVHAHNTFPLISPSIFSSISGLGVGRVLTLHNYRLFCAAGVPVREGRVCTECLDKRSVLPALRYGCYRGSRVASLPLALGIALHRALHTWDREIEAFVTLSEFQKALMTEAGLPASRVYVKPNFYPGEPPVVPWAERGDHVVFVGRLSREKGVHSLIEAWRTWGDKAPELRLIGDGELRGDLERQARDASLSSIRFLGQVSAEEAQGEIARARLLVLPSECFEGFPMVVREAFAFGTPVAVSNIGPLPSIVEDGVSGRVFEPANPQSLLRVVQCLLDDPEELGKLGERARDEFDSKYNENANYKILMSVYREAIATAKEV